MPPARLPPRAPDAHKGDFGTVLVVAGSRGMMGAAVLASTAALRSGAGLAVLVVPDSLVPVAMSLQVCATVRGVADAGSGTLAAGAAAEIQSIPGDVAVIGPGLGASNPTVIAVRELVPALTIPMVLDADGLNIFEKEPDLLAQAKAPKILTPHPGEMSRLVGRPTAEIQADRENVARAAAKRFGAVVVLKGHRTVVSDGERTWVNETGNAGMATGGSGDVLSGVIGGLLGQRLPPWDAACLGAHVHGLAGDLAARERGEISLIATDILDALPRAFRSLEAT
ncbi:MAG: NAD(P)H-hydrate dehydratase [Planctomycetes bacterium]|nr:NAD(P)H-hydrate dehydratase [Planctomycetota bacterium]